MSPSYRAGWIAAAAGGDDKCVGGTAKQRREYRAGWAAYHAGRIELQRINQAIERKQQ